MTQTVTNTINNIEQMLSTQKTTQKVSDVVNSGMDKNKDFTKVFESTINKEQSSINDLKTNTSKEDTAEMKNSIASLEFKEIVNKATDEANTETSLDLTLAKDINEIISQLKEAVENATEIIEENSSEETLSNEIISITEDNIEEAPLDSLLEFEEDNASTDKDNPEQKIPFEQVLTFVDKSIIPQNIEKTVETTDSKTEITNNIIEQVELTSDEIIEFTENSIDQTTTSKTIEEEVNNKSEFILDEDFVKDLKIESISTEAETNNGDTLMQNQSPEEFVIKTFINQETETFEVQLNPTSNTQNSQQVQTKPTEVNPSRILDQITKHFESLQSNSKVNIILNPESLGKVNIQLLSSKEGLTAQFTVTTQEAKDLLTKGLDGLKESLGTHGVAVDNVSIKVTDSQKSEYSQDWTEQDGSRGGNKGQKNPNREEKEKGLFEKMMAQTSENENGNV